MINGANGNETFNSQLAAVCALIGPNDPQPIPQLYDGIRDAVEWVASWSPRPVARIVGHRDLVSTECPGAELYRRLSQFAPGQRSWFDMATENDLRRVVREEIARAQVPRIVNGQPSTNPPAVFGNVIAFIDARILDILQRVQNIERRLQ
jgi:hypothetical protein